MGAEQESEVMMSPRKPRTFGAVLQAEREQRSLSLRALAKLADVDPSHLLRVERDEKPATPELVARLAKVLRMNVADLQARAAENLPKLAPYLRAKFDLPDEAVAELEEHFKAVSAQYKGKRRRS